MNRLCTSIGAGVAALALFAAPALAQEGACCTLDGDCFVGTSADCTAAGGAYEGDGTDCSDCSQNNCLEDDLNCQEPNIGQFPGGTILTSAPTADNFTANFTGTITEVCFWGAYIDIVALVDCDGEVNLASQDVTVTFYPNRESLPPFPNENLPTSFVGTIAARATGQEFSLGGFADTVSEYEYTITLAGGYPVTAGTCYWIQVEVDDGSANPDCAFFWEVSPEFVNDNVNGDGDDMSSDLDSLPGPPDPPGGIGLVAANEFEMAWCIGDGAATDTLGDPQDCYQAINAGCGENAQNQGPCNVINEAQPGCTDAECCTLVCDGSTEKLPNYTPQALCCQIAWIENCVDAAINQVGCVAQPVCGGIQEADQPRLCQVFATNNAYNSTQDSSGAQGDQFFAADDFSVDAASTVSSVCWQGVTIPAAGTPTNSFTVTIYADGGGLPGAVHAGPFGPLTLAGGDLTETDTNLNIGTFDIIEFNGDLGSTVNLDADTCYWMEIKNDIGADGSSWFWMFTETGDVGGNLYSGNGRLALDGQATGLGPDGYDQTDLIGGMDLAFCFTDLTGGDLRKPSCDLRTLFNTGPETVTDFDGGNTGAFGPTFLGWSSGCLDVDGDGDCLDDTFPNRRTAQGFSLPAVGPEGPVQSWRIDQVMVYGFTPDGVTNQDLVLEVYSRDGTTGLERPVFPDDVLVEKRVLYAAAFSGTDHPESGDNQGFPGAGHAVFSSFALPPGDYWLSVYADNPTEGPGQVPSNFAWFTNAKSGVINTCQEEPWPDPTPEDEANPPTVGCNDADPLYPPDAYLWRGRYQPDGAPGDANPGDGFGYGSYSLNPNTTLRVNANDPDPDPAKLYNASFHIQGAPGGICGNGVVEPGEGCDDGNTTPGDGCNSVCQEETGGTPCPYDCQTDPPGVGGTPNPDGNVGINDFLTLLAQWQVAGTTCDVDPNDTGAGINDFLALLAAWGPCP